MDPATIGYIAAFMSGLLFGGSDVLVRISVTGLKPKVMLAISLIVGTPLLFIVAVVSQDPFPSIPAVAAYFIAGILNFVAGRLLFYYAVSSLGATTASVITSPTILVSALLATLFLKEPLSIYLLAGLLLTMIGVTIVSLKPSGVPLHNTNQTIGIITGILSVLMFAGSAVFVRYAGIVGSSPLWGSAISYASALPFVLPYTYKELIASFNNQYHNNIVLKTALTAALLVALAQLSRYIALTELPVARAVILISLFPLHTLYLSMLTSKHSLEKIMMRHIVGSLISISGIIIAYSS